MGVIEDFWKKNCTAIVIILVIIVLAYYVYKEGMVVRHVYSSGASQRFATEQTASNQGPPGSVSANEMEAKYLEDLREESRKLMGVENFSNLVTMEPAPEYASLDEALESAIKNDLKLDPQGHTAYDILLQNQLYR